MQSFLDKLTNQKALNFIAKGEKVFASLPHLPPDWRDFLVKIAPYGALIGGALSIFGGLSAFGLSRWIGWGYYMRLASPGASVYFIISGVVMIASGALMLLAYKPLEQKQLKGWVYGFWVAVANLAVNILGAFLLYGTNLFSFVWIAVGFYLLFEIKPSYSSQTQPPPQTSGGN